MLTLSTAIAQTWECVVLEDTTQDTSYGFSEILAPYQCGDAVDYGPIPKYASHTPIKKIRVVLHIIQDENGDGNFDDIDINNQYHNSQSEYWVKLFNDLNNRYSTLKHETRQHPNHPTPIMKDSRIRFVLEQENIYYHEDPDFDDYDAGTPEPNGNYLPDLRLGKVFPKFVTDNPNMPFKDNALHVFCFPLVYGNTTNWAFLNSNLLALNGNYENFTSHGPNSWYMQSSSIAHEIAHCLGLVHTNRTDGGNCSTSHDDGCDDTPRMGPRNPCPCWDGIASSHGHTGDNDSCSTNLMTYNNKQHALTRGQVGKIHYSLMHHLSVNKYWINDYCEHDASETITISSGTNIVWENSRYLKGDLVIESGASLTIKCYLSLPNGAEIKVKPGGKFIIDGGRVGNVCGETFAGIRVYGHTNLSQTQANQGWVILRNGAIIENAHVGLSLIGLDANGELDWGGSGGIVHAINSTFRNNGKDVEFMSYHPKNSYGQELFNSSYFQNCTFVTTDNVVFANSALKEHVTMWDVNGVKFLGCSFYEQRGGLLPSASRIGIYSIDANFTVDQLCATSPCINPDQTEFTGLKNAIMCFGNGSKGLIRIENTLFESHQGVYLNGTFVSQVRANNFNITHGLLGGGPSDDIPYGLYLDLCEGFNTEGNQFNGLGSAATGSAAGLVVRNAGETINEFYRSEFNDLRVGSEAIGFNRNPISFDGLIFRCNDYENGFDDLYVVENDDPWSVYGPLWWGMAERQGIAGNWYPDNVFGNNSSLLNFNAENLCLRMDYLYDGAPIQSNRYYPYVVTTSTFYRLGYPHDKPCPDLIDGYGSETGSLVNNMMALINELSDKNNEVSELTDGGDSEHFLAIIEQATYGDKDFVFSELFAASPYLSNRVLAEMAQKEAPFSQVQVRDLLLANPHAARNAFVMELLNGRSDNFPQEYINSIEAVKESYTHRDTVLSELAALEYAYDGYLREYLAGKLADSTTTTMQLHPFLKHPTQPSYHYRLADRYFAQGKFSQFSHVKDSIPILFDLNERQLAYHDSYNQLHIAMQNWYAADSTVHRADTGRYNYLLTFSGNYAVLPPAYYAMMAINDSLALGHEVYIPETGSLPQGGGNMVEELLQAENEASAINLYPNPANNTVALEWKAGFVQSQVSVFDAAGRQVYQRQWSHELSLHMDTSNWPSGSYLIRIQTDTGQVYKRNLMINK